MQLLSEKKIYFASDFHLGFPNHEKSRLREKNIVKWLDSIKHDAQEIFLVGDVFDFWYEYKHVVPRGYVRFLGKLAELSDRGIRIHFFTGNHDIWINNYFSQEIGALIHKQPLEFVCNNRSFFIHHGHALGKYDKSMKFLTVIFENKFLQWCFSRIHPNSAIGFGLKWSKHNRKAKVFESSNFLGESKEWLLLFAKDYLQQKHTNYFIFGHRHVAMIKNMGSDSEIYNLGNWITNSTYGVFDGKSMQLKQFLNTSQEKILRI